MNKPGTTSLTAASLTQAPNELPFRQLLHVGCGAANPARLPTLFAQGWQEIRVDLDAVVKPHILCSIAHLACIRDQAVDAIYSSHNLEHLYDHEVSQALGGFHRVLANTGFAIITLPDLQQIAAWIVNDHLETTAYQSKIGPITPIDMLYGHRGMIAKGNKLMAHNTGFTATRLKALLWQAGFADVRVRQGTAFDLWAVACKQIPSLDFWQQLDQVLPVR